MLSRRKATANISRGLCLSNPALTQPLTSQLLALLRACGSTKCVLQIYAQMLVNAIDKSNFILLKLIDLRHLDLASRFFHQIEHPNSYAFNVMIRGLTTTWERFDLAVRLYYQMRELGVKPDNFTYPFVFKSCASLSALEHGRVAHSGVFRGGFEGDGHVSNSLITMYSSCGMLGDARKMFDEISVRDLVSWNSIISGCSKLGFAEEAVCLFWEMGEAGFRPDEMTLVSVLRACGELGDLRFGEWIRKFVDENEMELKFNTYIGSALIHMYSKCGDLTSARRTFDEMEKKDVVLWNAMITGYAQNGASDEAISLFCEMRRTSVEPSGITLIGALSSCASIGALELGQWIETYASRKGLLRDVYVATALIDMYAKCGSLSEALRIFEQMSQKSEASWNAMISAFAFHGKVMEALSLFERMLNDRHHIPPDDITLVAVLSACVHAGLVDEGLRLYHLMTSSFGLVPKIEHHSCIVDLLARAGRIYEAWDFVEQMPEKPDAVVLGALLGACQKMKVTEISERVTELLIGMEPSNSGNYVISSKMYAKEKRWKESASMWMLMRRRGVVKTPGCSWIEIDGKLEEFRAGDALGFETLKVFLLLNEEMRAQGYIPKVDRHLGEL
uniref:Chlororespiratory reduction 21 n=1 Tax=Kalanchoe fedtschenkoi TaxID=63787 RepID=A0A7N0UGY5_KALFE